MKLTRRLKFNVPRPTIYRALCEGLERVEGISDAIECFHQMASELTEETIMKDEQAEWFRGKQPCVVYVAFVTILLQISDIAAPKGWIVSGIQP